jgi:hypothetical protein
VGPKAAALGTSVQAGVVEADVLMWRPRQWRVGRVVLVVGQGGIGGSLGGRAGPKAAVTLGVDVQGEAMEGVRGGGGEGCLRRRWIW